MEKGKESINEKILELLKNSEEGMPPTEISMLMNKGYYNILDGLDKLEKSGEVEKFIFRRKTYWKLKHSEEKK